MPGSTVGPRVHTSTCGRGGPSDKCQMSKRDDFSSKTKRQLADRSNHRCSFPDCPQITSGPSDESPAGVNNVGVAAHIHGAASGRGSRRYLSAMSSQERRDITNGIWLCATHADLIDGDEATYTADDLRAMKRQHEDSVRALLASSRLVGRADADLIAVGPDVVFTGQFLGVDSGVWAIELHNFVAGDIHTLIAFIDRFEQSAPIDRYVLVNALGDGRALRAAPSMATETTGAHTLRCPVFPAADRIRAADLPKSWALSEAHDLYAQGGNIAMVSGVDALPQQVKTCLSHQRGESPLHPEFGTRFADYYRRLVGTPWLGHFLKLELIRQAAIPYLDPLNSRQYTPLQCVERVFGVEVLADTPANDWLPIRVELEVKGIGPWRRDLTVCVPSAPIVRPKLSELLAGPVSR